MPPAKNQPAPVASENTVAKSQAIMVMCPVVVGGVDGMLWILRTPRISRRSRSPSRRGRLGRCRG